MASLTVKVGTHPNKKSDVCQKIWIVYLLSEIMQSYVLSTAMMLFVTFHVNYQPESPSYLHILTTCNFSHPAVFPLVPTVSAFHPSP